ncbi:hypothetical protein AL714_07905 [Clostridium botulinum]|uniref:DUF4065 domain-containing protein n=1 Tax=Clostridium botulinum TaxID=1491 RepID=A0ABC8CYM2_CLOBO|nr:type II toxin-antitoxin system antitoxin SocA domain-containing protein [Clostridium botulinum]AVQ40481.1 DUF4065 domain-containing protein [Clostridium botulinum]NFA99017.1 DUF4065 domain-containing protein [Clostridium botulinum]NFB53990.1 DUF4065 domain-containing protein [Clostridium botulinum]NFC78372.1 DUF4065 domain-containing protein [Clostridium botulinum]NFC88904.1 DUF4065 domain-containing protein [Clostridium botulinum]
MYQHMILMCSDYSNERRIAFHKSYRDISSIIEFQKITELIKDEFKNIAFSFHHIPTIERTSKSVIEYDEYFRDVYFYSDIDKFKESITQSIEITPEDIIKYILIKSEFDQLQIQKLLFFTYQEYLKNHDEPLFKDTFEAWQYGPVIPEIYYSLKKYKSKKIRLEDTELEKIKLKLKLSRIYDKDSIFDCVDNVIIKYGNNTGGELIDKTHEKDSPWHKTVEEYGLNSEIPLELIKECVKAQI